MQSLERLLNGEKKEERGRKRRSSSSSSTSNSCILPYISSSSGTSVEGGGERRRRGSSSIQPTAAVAAAAVGVGGGVEPAITIGVGKKQVVMMMDAHEENSRGRLRPMSLPSEQVCMYNGEGGDIGRAVCGCLLQCWSVFRLLLVLMD